MEYSFNIVTHNEVHIVSLEFGKVVGQVQTMGRYLGHQNSALSDRLQRALDLLMNADDLAVVDERIQLVRRSKVSGYRGAAALNGPYREIIAGAGGPQPPPTETLLIAADGSQIYPDPHAPALYYLINIGTFIYHYADTTRLPVQTTQPHLVYSEKQLQDRDGRLITNQTVNARRSVLEMTRLAEAAWEHRDAGAALVSLYDGNLLKFFGGDEVADSDTVKRDYLHALDQLRDAGAALAAYAERSRSATVISLLHLLSLPDDQVTEAALRTNGELEGLQDVALFGAYLPPGYRSAMMVQNSPQNKEYADLQGGSHEIAFFYINVSDHDRPAIARVELPVWVATHPQVVDRLHAVLLAQCGIQGRRRFPYALTRADELAYVSSVEKSQLDSMIRVEMMKNAADPEMSNKLQSKGLARSARQHHRLRA